MHPALSALACFLLGAGLVDLMNDRHYGEQLRVQAAVLKAKTSELERTQRELKQQQRRYESLADGCRSEQERMKLAVSACARDRESDRRHRASPKHLVSQLASEPSS